MAIYSRCIRTARKAGVLAATWLRESILSSVTFLIVLWVLVLNWGEYTTFDKQIAKCDWSSWEHWPDTAVPHHLVFVADPQLVDPHTYPGRPWPLSTMTVKHTDMYLKRAFSRIEQQLDPDTVIFLGDLFDGGREWATRTSKSPEQIYQKYGEQFWMNEFSRFNNIFLREWGSRGIPSTGQEGRRIIASLPGNHDLGFGTGIQVPVRERFNAVFGDSNRIDIVGNHSFISLDTVSLSAKEQDEAPSHAAIWSPSDAFLKQARTKRLDTIARHLALLANTTIHPPKLQHTVHDLTDLSADRVPIPERYESTADFPSILLTHVPLYRAPGTPCGPLRERHPPSPPPSGTTDPVVPDERNAIPIWAGYQYQNTLTKTLTTEILDAFAGTIAHAFSGDDHDYCAVTHRAHASPGAGVHEITVKSISWAMGVRRPGFLMVSLWNPVDDAGKKTHTEATTLQTRLCLLPDQLGIFTWYLGMLCLSILASAVRAVGRLRNAGATSSADTGMPILPVAGKRNATEKEEYTQQQHDGGSSSASSSSSTTAEDAGGRVISSRGNVVRSSSPSLRGYALGLTAVTDGYANGKGRGKEKLDQRYMETGSGGRRKGVLSRFCDEWVHGLWKVARVVLLYYLYLIVYY